MYSSKSLLVFIITCYWIQFCLVQTINLANEAVLIQPGENKTLICTFKEKYDINPSMWYKQRPNQEPQQVGEVLKNKQAIPSSQFSNSRFKIIWDDTTNSLTILNLTEDYKGTYFCAVTDGRMIHFSSATFVNVTVKPMGPVVICLGAVLGVCAAVIIAQAIIILMFTKHYCSFPQQHDAEELNYAAIHFNERKTKRGQVKRGQHEDHVYSEVKRSALTDYHLDY
uniref:Ig-like domain-containing protein n=1 Tax=Electrophorus electricus TaxID=8005 RepID=A0A4W4E2T4_ELEEL